MSGAPPQTDSIAPAENADPLVGRTIAGKFAIEKLIGTGAMGAVYRARQIALDKIVAIKVLHRALASDKTFTERFHREAKAASRLDHLNSIRILDFGQEPDGLLYISMDYLDGRDLLDVITDDWPIATDRIVDILSQVLSALAVAHDLGVLHRDLKPENIMILSSSSDESGSVDLVKVCDFGIAKMSEKDGSAAPALPKLSTSGHVVGTPAYMSPEQAKGDAVDARSDLYAMGVVLYQMMTQRLPFDAPSSLSILYKHVNEEPIPPSFGTLNIDARLEAICLKAMAKKPEQRYANAREMRAALRSLVDADSRRSAGQSSGASLPAMTEPTAGLASRQSHASPSSATLVGLGTTAPGRGRRWMLWVGGATLALAVAAVLLWRRPLAPSPSTTIVTSIAAPPLADVEPALPGDPERRASGPRSVSSIAALDPHSPPAAASGAHRQRRSKSSAPEEAEPLPRASPNPPELPPLPAPRSTVVAAPAPTPAAPFDPAAARVDVGSAVGASGTTATSVNKAIAPLVGRITACYRSALTPSSAATESSGTLHIETNEDGVITDARLNARVSPAAAQCIVAAVKGRKIANVDTGSARADVPLVFKPR